MQMSIDIRQMDVPIVPRDLDKCKILQSSLLNFPIATYLPVLSLGGMENPLVPIFNWTDDIWDKTKVEGTIVPLLGVLELLVFQFLSFFQSTT